MATDLARSTAAGSRPGLLPQDRLSRTERDPQADITRWSRTTSSSPWPVHGDRPGRNMGKTHPMERQCPQCVQQRRLGCFESLDGFPSLIPTRSYRCLHWRSRTAERSDPRQPSPTHSGSPCTTLTSTDHTAPRTVRASRQPIPYQHDGPVGQGTPAPCAALAAKIQAMAVSSTRLAVR